MEAEELITRAPDPTDGRRSVMAITDAGRSVLAADMRPRDAWLATALTVTQLFDSLAIQIDGKRAWGTSASIRWHFTDSGETYRMELSNGVLIHYPTTRTEPADLVVTLTRPQLLALMGGRGADGVRFDGDPAVFATIAALTDRPDPAFPIVTP